MKIGIIAEDDSDFETLKVIIPKILAGSHSYKKMLGKGCGTIVSKCSAWSKALHDRGCTNLIVIRDADSNQPTKLKSEINNALASSPIKKRVVVIAVKELESWLLSDSNAIHVTFSAATTVAIKEISSPENFGDPKKHLSDLVKKHYAKTYLNKTHNPRIAGSTDIQKIRSKCPSFADLYNFLQ